MVKLDAVTKKKTAMKPKGGLAARPPVVLKKKKRKSDVFGSVGDWAREERIAKGENKDVVSEEEALHRWYFYFLENWDRNQRAVEKLLLKRCRGW